eukprot:TRINITY_DN1812_c0_g1_i2.p1 TRINITY_DN1812_c0_g1~~TRINITY_DN1812_c0_g1_i2.p1  ORF type:complete len:413 (-),score=52.31 TRINITY_DN1812_c0_g1_i2:202-1440(-)
MSGSITPIETNLKETKTYGSKHEKLSDDEIIIEGRVYDIKEFRKIHPGGKVINYYAAQDATVPFIEFHARSPYARKRLNTLKSRPVSYYQQDPLEKDYLELRESLKKEGFFDPDYLHLVYRISELLIFHLLGLYFLYHQSILGVILWSLGNCRVGWFMHEGGHCSLTGNSKIDKLLQATIFSATIGGSATYWNNQHNKHHAAPQKIQYDVDLNTLPLVVFNKLLLRDYKGPSWWIRYQGLIFWPITTTIIVILWVWYLHPRHMIRTWNKLELACYAVHTIIVFTLIGPLWYLLNAMIIGVGLFANFALSHTHKDIVLPNELRTWIQFSSDHTSNIEPSWWCDWWMGYLNYQIEHHLFPSIPQVKHRQLTERIKALFAKHGLNYDVRSYSQGVYDTFVNLDQIGQLAVKTNTQ